MNFILIVIIGLILLFVFIQYKNSRFQKKENFTNPFNNIPIRGLKIPQDSFGQSFTSVLVTPTNSVYNPLTLYTWDNDNRFYNEWGNKLSEIFPVIVKKSNGSIDNLNEVNRNKMNLALVQEDTLILALTKGLNNVYENIRFISYVGFEKPILIVSNTSNIKSWLDLGNKRLYLGEENSGTYKMGLNLLKLVPIEQNSVKIISGPTEGIEEKFNKNEIDAYFVISNQPDREIYKIIQKSKGQIIGLEGIPKDLIKTNYPLWEEGTVDRSEYELTILSTLKTYNQKIALICHKEADYQSIYNLTKTLIRNHIHFKSGYKENFNTISQLEFNPDNQFSTNPLLVLHPAIIDFYREIGMLDKNEDKKCGYFIGIDECRPDLVSLPYRLL